MKSSNIIYQIRSLGSIWISHAHVLFTWNHYLYWLKNQKIYTYCFNLLLPKAYWVLFALTANARRKMVDLMDSILLDYDSGLYISVKENMSVKPGRIVSLPYCITCLKICHDILSLSLVGCFSLTCLVWIISTCWCFECNWYIWQIKPMPINK